MKELFKVEFEDKSVIIKKPTIGILAKAQQLAAAKAPKGVEVSDIQLGIETLKLVIVKINDKPLSAMEIEDLDAIFEVDEFAEMMGVVGELRGAGKPKPKVTAIVES